MINHCKSLLLNASCGLMILLEKRIDTVVRDYLLYIELRAFLPLGLLLLGASWMWR